MSELKLQNISKSFGQHVILKDVSLQSNAGEFIVFVGPSGCGKSTLLRLICGLETVTSGTIHIGEKEVTNMQPAQRNLAMVFQSYALFPHLSVRENMGYGLRCAKVSENIINQKVDHIAAMLQMTHLLERKPKDLSGGQRQRVAIGRAIAVEPSLFLFDEPLSNLDAGLRHTMRFEIAKLHRELGKTTVYVTHDQVEAMGLADRIVVLNQGHIEQIGTPMELYQAPANVFVASFLGSPNINLIHGDWHSNGSEGQLILEHGVSWKTPLLHTSARATLGIRSEKLRICNTDEGLFNARVTLVERLGSHAHVYLDGPGSNRWVARTEVLDAPPLGSVVGARANPQDMIWFDDQQNHCLQHF
jgi:multiple sugar transport system ATP-binding protein